MATGVVCVHCAIPVNANNASHYCKRFKCVITHEQALDPNYQDPSKKKKTVTAVDGRKFVRKGKRLID